MNKKYIRCKGKKHKCFYWKCMKIMVIREEASE